MNNNLQRQCVLYVRRFYGLALILLLNACAFVPAKQVMPLSEGLDIYRTDKTPAPTVLLVPGCGGMNTNGVTTFHPRIAKILNEHGFNAIILDYVKIMGQNDACMGQIKFEQVQALITEALHYTAAQPFVDRDHIALLGWSLGASGVLTVANHTPVNQQPSIKAIVGYYPGCYSGLEFSVYPTLLLLGMADNVIDPNACIELAKKSPQAPVTIKTYAEAQHGFDVAEFKEAQTSHLLWKKFTAAYNEAASDDAIKTVLQFLDNNDK